MTATLTSFEYALAEPFGRLVGKDAVQSLGDAVELLLQFVVAPLLSLNTGTFIAINNHKVHKQSVFGQRSHHHATIG